MDISLFEKPLVMGHRGFPAQYPENTLVSFEAAVAAGAQFVELDVVMTRDGQLAVIHDDTVDRTTDGKGPVSEYDLKELRNLDAGRWFDPRFAGERIPSLGEVLEQLVDRVCINIEIKSHGRVDSGLRGETVQAVTDLVRSKTAEKRVLISSFDHRALERVKQLCPGLATAFISKQWHAVETVSRCRDLGVFSFHPRLSCLDGNAVKAVQTEGFHVFPFNIHTTADIHKAMEMGADGLIADDPSLVHRLYRSE